METPPHRPSKDDRGTHWRRSKQVQLGNGLVVRFNVAKQLGNSCRENCPLIHVSEWRHDLVRHSLAR